MFVKQKKAIFVNGCFWHKHNCKYFKWPKTNAEFWKKKISDTVVRDEKNYKELSILGWDVLVVWECELKHRKENKIQERVVEFLSD